ncbi:MAG: hypothetical protein PHY34_01205 [Patescibacteria group bacterium]|nr:hypothetical protein [Patescibacteria group bacterium]MDD5715164.1 hypothetical protein [Patescibacteria group bacterium]
MSDSAGKFWLIVVTVISIGLPTVTFLAAKQGSTILAQRQFKAAYMLSHNSWQAPITPCMFAKPVQFDFVDVQ